MTIPVNSGVTFRGSGSKIREILNYYPGSHANLYITSSYRGYSTGSHHATGNAVDVASPEPWPAPLVAVAHCVAFANKDDLSGAFSATGVEGLPSPRCATASSR